MNGGNMQVVKFRENTINGIDESTFKWKAVTDKDELMVEVFTSEELFKDLSVYWKALDKRANPVVPYNWIYNWWKRFGKNKQRSLYLITIWDGTKLIGVAPLYKGYSVFGNLKLETRLQIIGSGGNPNEQLGYLDDYGIGDSLDIIVDPSYIKVVAELLAEDIFTPAMVGVDVIKFHRVSDDSFIAEHLLPRMKEQFSVSNIKQSDADLSIQHVPMSDDKETQASDNEWCYTSEEKHDGSHNQTISICIKERGLNIPLFLNRVGAFIYKYLIRERRLVEIQRQQKSITKMLQGYFSFHWMGSKLKSGS